MSFTVSKVWLTKLFTEGENINLAVAQGLPKHAQLVDIKVEEKDRVTFKFKVRGSKHQNASIELRYQ
jgi:hypothetical protein